MNPTVIEILAEEASMALFLEGLLPRILPPDYAFGINCFVRPHEGKSDLQKSIPKKLRAFTHFPYPVKVLIYTGELGNQSGDRLPIVVEHEVVGYALRTQVGVKPVFVSPGHAISLATSAAVSLQLASSSRQLEPIRRADQAARAFAKGTAGAYTRLG
jgi:Endonuclease V